MSWCRALLAALLCNTAAAQAPPTEAASAALPPETVSLPASTVPAPSPPEPPLSCAAATSRAMAAELKLAQSSATAVLGQLVQLQELALVYWRLAVTRCDGRARERAERLLQDNEKARAQLAEREHAGAQCEISMRDAAAMQELAKTAFGERRWPEAGSLYRKAETLWDLAAEHCGGAQQQLASRRREEAEIDGHNAESCAPSFEHAREATGRLRALGGGAAPADRERASQVAETGWREALALCRGPALDLARANAEGLGTRPRHALGGDAGADADCAGQAGAWQRLRDGGERHRSRASGACLGAPARQRRACGFRKAGAAGCRRRSERRRGTRGGPLGTPVGAAPLAGAAGRRR